MYPTGEKLSTNNWTSKFINRNTYNVIVASTTQSYGGRRISMQKKYPIIFSKNNKYFA
jgi:hypothetical protein